MKTNKNIIGFCIIALVLTLNLAMAFSPISGYSEQNPLSLYPGQEKEAIIHIYSTPEEGVISVEAIIIEGMDIASITDESNIYSSSLNKEGLVHVKVSIPSSATIGSEYIVKSRFVDKNQEATAGTLSFNIKATNTFKVVVVEKPAIIEETPQGEGIGLTGWVIGIIVVIAIILVIYFILKKRNE